MSKIELTKQWVNDALDTLIANNTLSYNQVNSSSDKLVALFKQKAISKSTITAFEFLVACVGYFIFQDLKQQKYSPAVNLNERKNKVGYSRDLTWMDVKESKERFNALLDELSVKLAIKCELEEKQSLFSLLQLISQLQKENIFDHYIQKYRWDYGLVETNDAKHVTNEQQVGAGSAKLIPKKFIAYILYGHYGLDSKLAEEGRSYVDLCDAEEVCNLLKVSKNNLVKKCLECSFGAYLRINSDKYRIKKFYHLQYDQELINEIVDSDYLYPYQGLVRIKKQSDFKNELSLQAFYAGDGICWKYVSNKEQLSHDTFLVPIEPSLSEVIQGVCSYILLHKNQKIKVEDFLFITEEIQNEKPKKENKKIRHEQISTAVNKFITHINEKSGINVKQDALPITKNELIAILKNHFSLKVKIEDETIKDYFSFNGIKFQRGIKSGSAVYQDIIKTF